ncbi:MAG: hypothetical protein ACE5F9_05365 [Phycisphaerae bacterium]
MADLSPHQKRIVDRYYQHRDTIMTSRLGELVTELYLAETDRGRDRLWTRAEKAMRNLEWKDAMVTHILERRRPEILAEHLNEWMKEHPAD